MKNTKTITRRKFLSTGVALSAFMIVPRFVLGGKGYLAPSDRITLGLIGNGRQGHNLLHSFLGTGEVQMIATCDVYKSKRDDIKDKINLFYAKQSGKNNYKGCTACNDFRELLDRKDLDGVVISTPDHWHAVQAVRAAEAGKDIYCEKPLALTIKEGRAIVNAVEKYDCVFQTGSMQRSWPEFRQCVELIRNGYIGEVKSIKVSVGGPPKFYDLPKEPLPDGLDWDFWLGPNSYYHYNHEIAPPLHPDFWARWRYYKPFGGGDMTDWGAHMFDIVQWALDMDNSGPVEITPPDGKAHPFLTYRYANNIVVTKENFGQKHAIRFIGTKGQIDIRRHHLETNPALLKDQKIGSDEKQVYYSDNHYKDWLNAIRDRSKPICDAETGHRSATVCNLGNIAFELKRPLYWNPEKEKFKKDKEANRMRERKLRKPWTLKI